MNRRIRNSIVMVLLSCMCMIRAYGQEFHRTEIGIDFRVNRAVLDTTYLNNSEKIQEIIEFVTFLQTEHPYLLREVSFRGAASPEGSYELNVRLARQRMEALERFIRSRVSIPDSVVRYDDSYISWEYLKREVSRSDLANKDTVLQILNSDSRLVDYYGGNQIDDRIVRIQRLDNGKTWSELQERYFQLMRAAYVVFELYRQDFKSLIPNTPTTPVQEQYAQQAQLQRPASQSSQELFEAYASAWHPQWYVNTNALALGMGITSVGAEFGFAPHWSVALPVMYSAWNYFIPTIKFRTFSLQPELRYWFGEDHLRWYIGGHGTFAYYNVAVDGGLRYQDHAGERPGYGGGLSVGYRVSLTRSKRLNLEFAVGAGVYYLHYDTFYNVPNGKYVSTHEKTYFGPDQASITLSYQFTTPNARRR